MARVAEFYKQQALAQHGYFKKGNVAARRRSHSLRSGHALAAACPEA